MSDAYAEPRSSLQAAADAMAQAGASAATRAAELIHLREGHDGLRLPGLPRWTRLMLALAPRITHGSLAITLPDGRVAAVRGSEPGPDAALAIHDHRFARDLLLGGNLAVGRAYIDGRFDSDDLAALIEFTCRNADLDDTLHGRPWLRLARRLAFALDANSRRGSRRNIARHYDLGNDFYACWLDPSMTYSAALWQHGDETLEQAQDNKYRRLAGTVLRLQPDQTVLEIGCGWGGFASLAAREFGARVHAVTISRAQHDYTAARIQREGLNDRVRVELRDYRDLAGRYDAVASIEMIEAVGEQYWPVYFRQLRNLVGPGGRIGLQAILIADHNFARYRRTMDFIQAYIFPGGLLPSPAAMAAQSAAAGLAITDQFCFGADYARTLRDWRDRFEAAWPEIRAQGFDERFRRMWRYYLAYCEGGFRAGCIDVAHYGLAPA
jgi:cyclopropane-fatty-acyl-phospholipid synthase